MAHLKPDTRLDVSALLKLNEQELAALAALACYGTDPFLKAFYEQMGKAYLQPHEAGLRTPFEMARTTIPPLLSRVEAARTTFDGGNRK